MGKQDKIKKVYLSEPRRYADLWNTLFYGGEQVIDWQNLKEDTSVFTLKTYGIEAEKTADIVMKEEMSGKRFQIFALENQDEIDYSMPARVMLLEAISYHNQVKEIKKINRARKRKTNNSGEYLYHYLKNDKIVPVHTLVLYWGSEPWDGPKDIRDMMDCSDSKFREYLPSYPIKIVELSDVGEECKFTTELGVVITLYNLRNDKKAYESFIQSQAGLQDLERESVEMLATMTNSKELMEYLEKRQEEEKVTVCKAITELIEDGREEGREEGILTGRLEGIQDTIISIMKAKGEVPENLQDAIRNMKDEMELTQLSIRVANAENIEMVVDEILIKSKEFT